MKTQVKNLNLGGCWNCPHREYWGTGWNQQHLIQHCTVNGRVIRDEELDTVPDWCPLRTSREAAGGGR